MASSTWHCATLGIELLGKVEAGLHGVDVHEQLVAGIFQSEVIEQPSGNALRIVTAVVDKNMSHDPIISWLRGA
jgi:hypothetical protein